MAVSGSTVDGREISPVHLREAAENFNPDVYAARVNVEHYLSPCPSSEFSAMGDVTALSTEDITEGPLAGRTALYAEIEPTERMKQLVADGKKIYSSIELHPQFSVKWMFKDGAVVKRIYTADEQQQQAESQKAALLSEAENVIQPLERAVRLNMATEEERTRLESWERYSVLVSRVDTANPEWPQKPE
ncbi:TPA: capsid protein [Escherichia coli]|nr:capsid protein [Escherichia coli]